MNTLISGRLLLIVITVTAATGGFILGYVVGKQGFQPAPMHAPQGAVSQDNQMGTPAGSPGAQSFKEKPAREQQPAATEASLPVAETPPSPGSTVASHRPVQAVSEQSTTRESPEQLQKKPLYTVQAGAFKSRKEALALQKRLESKGYSPLLREETTTQGTKLFKIQLGEFNGKKEASAFALELRQSDGLKAFAVKN